MSEDRIKPPPPIRPGAQPAAPTGNNVPSPRAPAAAAPTRPKEKPAPAPPKDAVRETVETVVFVVVLVLLLKTFVAEAFVIPTGSMATTLWGYQKVAKCPECGYRFPVNCSSQADPQHGQPVPVLGCTCPNCRFPFAFDSKDNPDCGSGDRVLVAKFLFDAHVSELKRHDVVVFKFPDDPQKNHVPMNYIKRAIGLPGETIAIFYGKLYRSQDLRYDDESVRPEELRKTMHKNHPEALKLFQEGKFEIIRKAPDKVLAMRRLIYDNDHQATDLLGKLPPRWQADRGAAWKADSETQPHRFDHASRPGGGVAWLRYHHILRGRSQPELITDFMGYNTGRASRDAPPSHPGVNWVGDLLLECQVKVENADKDDDVVFELSKGVDRFQAVFRPASGQWTLFRIRTQSRGEERTELASRSTRLTGAGTYQVRFANVDERLVVWIDEQLPFDQGVPYDPPANGNRGPAENDLEPASIGVKGAAVSISALKLWRDTYYTTLQDIQPAPEGWLADADIWHDQSRWDELRRLRPQTYYVQPGHYLCLGDNSPESSDGRYWGLVPERLLLGRALMVYYPFYCPSWPLNNPVNRAGPIK
jgi:signal peptidase I